MTRPCTDPIAEQIRQLASRVQGLAAYLIAPRPNALADGLEGVVESLPSAATIRQRPVIRSVLSSAFVHVIDAAPADMRSMLAPQLLGWVKPNPMLDSWREEASGLLRKWIAALRLRSRQIHNARAVTDPRLERALNWLDAHYCTRATLRDFAAEAGLSPWHAARMLKQGTGRTFMAHVNERRISEAEHLLSETTLSVKEIAARVGYVGSSQLGRHFKRLRRRTPAAHRRVQQESTSNSKN